MCQLKLHKKGIKKEKMRKKVYIPILILIIIFQILLGIYIGSKKQYLHIDEAYSYGLMNYDKENITDNEDFFNNWHDKEYFLDYLEVNSDEVTDLKPVYENQKNDVHPPLYYLLLRIAATFTVDNFTMWTGIILNIIILGIASIILFAVSKKVFNSPLWALLVTGIYAISMALMETTLYIRMYALSTLNILLYILITIKIEEKQKNGKIDLKYMILTSLILLLGGLTHYYFFVYVFGTYIFILIKHIRKKEHKFILKYTLTLAISAVIYLLIFPYAINHVFFGYIGIDATQPVTLNNMIEWIKSYVDEINKNIFNYGLLYYIIAIIGLFVIFKMVEKIRKNDIKKKREKNPFILFIIIPTLLYFFVVLIQSPYKELRYIMPICPEIIFITIYITKALLEKYIHEKYLCSALVVVFMIISLTLGFTDNKLKFAYEEKTELVNNVKSQETVIIYVLNPNNNRFLDNMYLYTLASKTYILEKDDDYYKKVEQLKKENINTSNVIVFVNN